MTCFSTETTKVFGSMIVHKTACGTVKGSAQITNNITHCTCKACLVTISVKVDRAELTKLIELANLGNQLLYERYSATQPEFEENAGKIRALCERTGIPYEP